MNRPLDPSADLPRSSFNDPADEELWTQPQFGLGSLLVVMIPCAIAFAVISKFGAEFVFPTIVVMLVVWILVTLGRVVGQVRQIPEEDGDPL